MVFDWYDNSFPSVTRLLNPDNRKHKILDMICQINDSLDFLHRRNTVHGDLKPNNILVNLTGEEDQWVDACLADFGLSIDVSGDRCIYIPSWRNKYYAFVQDEMYTPKFDVHCFGIVMFYGLMYVETGSVIGTTTLGTFRDHALKDDDGEELKDYLSIELPSFVTSHDNMLIELMIQCVNPDQDLRPNCSLIHKVLTMDQQYKDSDQSLSDLLF